jgi:uncharacterized protein
VSAEALTAIAAAIASFLSGLLGIGGGIVLTPLLLYGPALVGAPVLPVKIITGLTIVQAIAGSVLGTLRHRSYGHVSAHLVRTMGPAMAGASLVGALVSRDAPDRLLIGIFAAFSLAGAATLLLPPRSQDVGISELRISAPLAAGLAAFIGFFGGMVGIGAIAFVIAALVYLLRVPPRIAIGSSLGIGVFGAVAALVGKAATAQVDPYLAAIVLATALVASPAGSAASRRTPARLLMLALAVVVALAGVRMAWQALTGT